MPAPSFLRITINSFGAEYLLSPDRDLIYIPKPNTGEYNSYGHRGKVFDKERNEKERILFIGDSVVEGYGAPLEARFTDLLAEKYRDRCEIINLAVRGYNLKQEVAYFKSFCRQFKPDYVFLGITYNDLILHSGEISNIDRIMKSHKRSNFYKRYFNAREGFEALMLKLHIYRHFAYFFASRSDNSFREAVKYETGHREARELVNTLKELSEADDFGLCFVFLPINTANGVQDMALLKNFAMKVGIDILDLNEALSNRITIKQKRQLFVEYDPCHLNSKGHEVTASLLEGKVGEVIGNR